MAYTFITNQDLLRQIRQEFLTNLQAGLAQADLDKEENAALITVMDKLRGRYDVTAIKAADPKDDRVVQWVCSIFLYKLHRRQNPRAVPEDVAADYEATIQWLNDIRDGKEHCDLPLLPDDSDGNPVPGTNDLRAGGRPIQSTGNFFLGD